MRNLSTVFCFIFFAFIVTSFGQSPEKVDSLLAIYQHPKKSDTLKIKALSELFNLYLYNDQEQAKKYLLILEKLSTSIHYEKGIARGQYFHGILSDLTGQLDSAKYYYQIAHYKYAALKDTLQIGRTIFNLGNIAYQEGAYEKAIALIQQSIDLYQQAFGDDYAEIGTNIGLISQINQVQGHHQIALKNALLALKIHQENGNEIRSADILNLLGAIELDLGNFQKAIQCNQEAIVIYKAKNDRYFQANATNDIGLTYIQLNDNEKAEKYLLESIELAQQMNARDLVGTGYLNLAKIFTRKEQFNKALNYLEKSLAIHEESGSTHKIIETLNGFGKTYLQMNQANKAISFFNSSLSLADSIKAYETIKIARFNRSEAYEKLGNTKLALEEFKQFQSIHDTILNKVKIQQIEELRIIHDTERKEQSIELQKNQIVLLEQEATLNRLQKWFLSLGLGFSLVIFGLGYYGFRQKLKRNRLAREQQKLLHKKELNYKKRELITHALHLAKKNELLDDLKQKAMSLKASEHPQTGYQKLINAINFDLQDDNNWANFSHYFEQLHTDFNGKVLKKYPKVTSNELRLMALLKMNLSSKEIANILNISAEGVKKARQRLRKKLDLTPTDSLEHLILNI